MTRLGRLCRFNPCISQNNIYYFLVTLRHPPVSCLYFTLPLSVRRTNATHHPAQTIIQRSPNVVHTHPSTKRHSPCCLVVRRRPQSILLDARKSVHPPAPEHPPAHPRAPPPNTPIRAPPPEYPLGIHVAVPAETLRLRRRALHAPSPVKAPPELN